MQRYLAKSAIPCATFLCTILAGTSSAMGQPSNNFCDDREQAFNGKTPFDNTGATQDGPANPGSMTGDIWFNYVATEDGEVDIDTCQAGAGDNDDTTLAVYKGCVCPVGDPIASNDDADVCGPNSFLSSVKIPVVAGNCYKIQIGGFFGSEGTGTLTITKQAPPPPGPNNDLCADRKAALNGKTPFDNTGAALDGPDCTGTTTGDVWFNYVATEDGFVDIDTCQADAPGDNTDTTLAVYKGCDPAACPPAAGSELACNDDAGCGPDAFNSSVKIPVTAGNCYKIQIGGFSGEEGTGLLTITKQAVFGACCFDEVTCVDVANEAECVALGGTFQGGGTECATVTCPPAPDSCDQPFDHEVTQNVDNTVIDLGGVSCAAGGITTENSWARSYDMSVELPGKGLLINCVEFAMSNSGSTLTGVVIIYEDTDGGEPGSAGQDLVVLASKEFALPGGADLELFQASFDPPVKLPVDATIVVAVDLPPSDDGFATFAGNSLGQSGATYILSASCGITKYLDLAVIGFPDNQWVQTLRGVNQGAGASLDIKPGSCPNSFNRNSNGVLPVALVGTDTFDVKAVDLDTLLLVRKDDPSGGGIAPLDGPPGPGSHFEDVATPFAGEEQCDCTDAGADGLQDLSLKFRTSDLVAALGLGDDPNGATVSLTLIGNLLDGTSFEADDCVRLVPPGTGDGLLAVGSNLPDVWIDLSPMDEQLDGGGFANFERTFPFTTVVTLTAPAEFHGWLFVAWLTDGGLRPGQSIDLNIREKDQQIEAIYRPVPPPTLHKQ